MKNELGFDTSQWANPDAAMHFAEGMYMDNGLGYGEGTTQVLADMRKTGVLTSVQLEWMHRYEKPEHRKPMRILAWLRRRLDLPFGDRSADRGQMVTTYLLTPKDHEILETAFFYLHRGFVEEKIRFENRDPRNDEDGMG